MENLNSNVVSILSKGYEEEINLRNDTVYIKTQTKQKNKNLGREYTKAFIKLLSDKVN